MLSSTGPWLSTLSLSLLHEQRFEKSLDYFRAMVRDTVYRELLGDLARLAYETVREMMAAASDEPDARPGMVAVIQTFGSSLKWNP